MEENNTVRKFQMARLDEWIGDYASADKIYDEIIKSDDKLSQVFKKTIQKRQGKLNKKIDIKSEKETDSMRENDDDLEINFKLEIYVNQKDNYEQKVANYIKKESYFIEDYRIIKSDSELLKLYDDNLLEYQKLNYSKLSDNSIKWKYSVSVISKVEK